WPSLARRSTPPADPARWRRLGAPARPDQTGLVEGLLQLRGARACQPSDGPVGEALRHLTRLALEEERLPPYRAACRLSDRAVHHPDAPSLAVASREGSHGRSPLFG